MIFGVPDARDMVMSLLSYDHANQFLVKEIEETDCAFCHKQKTTCSFIDDKQNPTVPICGLCFQKLTNTLTVDVFQQIIRYRDMYDCSTEAAIRDMYPEDLGKPLLMNNQELANYLHPETSK